MTLNQLTILRISTDGDHPVWADLYTPDGQSGVSSLGGSIVVLCHGLKGYRRWGFIPRLGDSLRQARLAALAIDFSHNGPAGGDGDASDGRVYPRPELFRQNTLDRERRDLASVIRWIRKGGDGRVDPTVRIGLWGHSRGGGSVLLNALDDPADIAAVATWSATAHADSSTPRQKARWREAGEYDFLENANGERLAMGVGFLDDLESRHAEYALADRAASLTVPHLIVHGDMDLVIPVHNAERYRGTGSALAEKKLVRLRTGHTFGIGKTDDSIPLREAIEVTVDWFRRFLLNPGEDA